MGKTCLGKMCLKRKWLEHIWRQNYSFVPDDVFYYDGCYWFRLSLFNFEYESALNYSFEMNVVREMKGCGDMSIAIGKRNNFARSSTKWSPLQVLTPSDGTQSRGRDNLITEAVVSERIQSVSKAGATPLWVRPFINL